jgi:hypothetical protein
MTSISQCSLPGPLWLRRRLAPRSGARKHSRGSLAKASEPPDRKLNESWRDSGTGISAAAVAAGSVWRLGSGGCSLCSHPRLLIQRRFAARSKQPTSTAVYRFASRSSVEGPDLPGKVQIFCGRSRPSGKGPDLLGKVPTFRERSRPSGKGPDLPGKVQTFWERSRPSGKGPDLPGKVPTFWERSRPSAKGPDLLGEIPAKEPCSLLPRVRKGWNHWIEPPPVTRVETNPPLPFSASCV